MTEIPHSAQRELPSPDEVVTAAAILAKFEQGQLPYPIFLQLARLATISTVELVPIRDTTNGPEVLLLQRPEGDMWEHEWHVPGTVLVPGQQFDHEHDFSVELDRLIGENGELKSGVTAVNDPVLIATDRRRTRRGDEMSAIHYVEVAGEPAVGEFFPIEGFPENVPEHGVIDHHVAFIQRAVKRFIADRQ